MSNGVSNVDANRFRRQRFQIFLSKLKDLRPKNGAISVLDVGGTMAYWEGVRDMWAAFPLDITIVNLGVEESDQDVFHIRNGNACDLGHLPDRSFDIVHSNSVIEHVGQWVDMEAMAGEVRRLASSYYLQTPNFWFPMEPHYRTLFFQMYPEAMRARMLMTRRRGFRGPHQSLGAAMRDLQTVNLLTARQLSALFPDGKLIREKFCGLTKSLIVCR